jgi:hypothetical protein
MDKYDDHPCVKMLEEDPMFRRIFFESIESATLWEKMYYGTVVRSWYALLRFLRVYSQDD